MEKNLKINSLLNVIKTIFSIIFPLITFPYVSRILQPDNIGKVNFASSYVSYFSMIATLGATTYAIRECSAAKNNSDSLRKTASEIYSITICTSIVSYSLMIISILIFPQLGAYRMLIFVHSISIIFNTIGADWLNTAMEDFIYITLRTIAFQVVSLICMFLFVKTKEDYMVYALITVMSASGANLLNAFYRKKYCSIHFTLNMKWSVHFKPILLLFVMILAQTIFSSADITMLGIMKNDFEVGIYSTGVKLTNLISQVVSSLAWVVMPRMSLYFASGNYEQINILLEKVLSVLITIGLPIVGGVSILAKDIVIIVGGEQYSAAAIPLIILMISFAFSLVGGCFLGNMVLLPAKRERVYMIICCISTVVNVVLNSFLIPLGGAIAASATTAFSSLLILVMLIITKDRRIKLDYIFRVIKSPVIGTVFILIYCFIITSCIDAFLIRVVVCIGGSILGYGIILMITKNVLCMQMLELIKRKLS